MPLLDSHDKHWTPRERAIVRMLERWPELTESAGGNGEGGSGTVVALTPHARGCRLLTNQSKDEMPRCSCFARDVTELRRLLELMRTERQSQFWHVTKRYIDVVERTADVPVKRKAKNGKTVTVVERQLVISFSSAVRPEKVRRGVSWLAVSWALPHEPMLPHELIAA